MDLDKYKELADLDEKIYRLKNRHFEVQNELFDQIGMNADELPRLNFVNDFKLLISQNIKKMSSLTLTLMNQSEEANDLNCIFKLKKELKSDLIEYLQRIINFTLKDEKGKILTILLRKRHLIIFHFFLNIYRE